MPLLKQLADSAHELKSKLRTARAEMSTRLHSRRRSSSRRRWRTSSRRETETETPADRRDTSYRVVAREPVLVPTTESFAEMCVPVHPLTGQCLHQVSSKDVFIVGAAAAAAAGSEVSNYSTTPTTTTNNWKYPARSATVRKSSLPCVTMGVGYGVYTKK